MAILGKKIPIEIAPGVNPLPDNTNLDTNYFTAADKIRFVNARPWKLAGWVRVLSTNYQRIRGAVRSLFSYIASDKVLRLLAGSHTGLYNIQNNAFFNITPLINSAVVIPDSMATNYATLGTDPIATTDTTRTITVTYTPFVQGNFAVGDKVLISGVSGSVGAIAANDINGTATITSVGATTFTFESSSATAATSTASGGGVAVILSSRVITITLASHTYINGDAIRVSNASAFAGFIATDINITGVVRNTTANTFDYYLTAADTSLDFATSSVSSQGGSSITVLGAVRTVIANSLSTNYNSNAAYSVSTTSGSNIVTFNVTNYLNVGDTVTISGVSGAVGGVPVLQLNNTFLVVRVNDTDSFSVVVATTATSTTTGGGGAIQIAAAYITVTITNHGMVKGQRFKLQGVTTSPFGGIPINQINAEQIVSNVIDSNNFVFSTGTIATSSVVLGGGSGITIQNQIPAGNADQSIGIGYGGGLYGVGLYGVAKIFNKGALSPRIWSFDRYGNTSVMSPGGGGRIYQWTNDTNIAPQLVANSPIAVDWIFVSHGALCALSGNQFIASDVANITEWTPGASNLAYSTTIPGADPFISQASSRDIDILFTKNSVYLLNFVDNPDKWIITDLFKADGIIAPNARCEIEDSVFWMGEKDFYVFDGYTVSILPNNTLKRYVFNRINYAQSLKIFVFPNPKYSEVWFFYPAGSNTEISDYVIYNYKEQTFTPGTLNRTAGEAPTNLNSSPDLVDSNVYTTTVLPNSIATHYIDAATLGNNKLATTNTSAVVTLTLPSTAGYAVGDQLLLAGAVGFNSITSGELNTVQTIASIPSTTTVTFATAGVASATGTGGGNAITIGTQRITITYINNLTNGDTIGLSGITNFGGFLASTVNRNGYIVRNRLSSSFDVFLPNITPPTSTTGYFSTSLVSAAGGTLTSATYARTARLYMHDIGTDDYNPDTSSPAPMSWYLESNYGQLGDGDKNMLLYSIVPDSTQTGNIELIVYAKRNPQSTIITSRPDNPDNLNPAPTFTITPTTEKIDVMALGRQTKMRLAGNSLGNSFQMGKWYAKVKETTPR